ncbi:MAG: flagellar basal body L-ring protein FlgH, partial [Burkholderiaceae bacterium]
MKQLKPAAIVLAALLLAACAKPMPLAHSPDFAPVQPLPRETNMPATGAIFATDNTDLWQAKRRNYRVGDIITVLLSESTQAARTLNNETSRESSTDAVPTGMSNAIGNAAPILNGFNAGGAVTTNRGTGVADQRASLTGSIAGTVTEVQANGNLVIRGEKQ